MDDIGVDEQAEQLVRALVSELTEPRAGECLFCYASRMLEEFGCDDTLRFARSYRDLRAPRATSMERRLGDMGGFCDCEIFLNAMAPAAHLRRYDSHGEEVPAEIPPCGGVRRGSTQECANWTRWRRGARW